MDCFHWWLLTSVKGAQHVVAYFLEMSKIGVRLWDKGRLAVVFNYSLSSDKLYRVILEWRVVVGLSSRHLVLVRSCCVDRRQ